MVPILVTYDVNIKVITILQNVIIRNAMRDDIIDRGAHGFGKMVEADGGRVRIVRNDVVVHNFVNVV